MAALVRRGESIERKDELADVLFELSGGVQKTRIGIALLMNEPVVHFGCALVLMLRLQDLEQLLVPLELVGIGSRQRVGKGLGQAGNFLLLRRGHRSQPLSCQGEDLVRAFRHPRVQTVEDEFLLLGEPLIQRLSKAGDLAIVDLFLKQGSGLGVLEACRGRPAGQRVVVLSNYATADMRKRCAQLGADAVFDKSNEIDALVEYCIQQCETPRPGA